MWRQGSVPLWYVCTTTLSERLQNISLCGLLHGIFVSAVPLPKEIVFTRAKDVYGCEGPDVGHPFAIKFTSNGPS